MPAYLFKERVFIASLGDSDAVFRDGDVFGQPYFPYFLIAHRQAEAASFVVVEGACAFHSVILKIFMNKSSPPLLPVIFD